VAMYQVCCSACSCRHLLASALLCLVFIDAYSVHYISLLQVGGIRHQSATPFVISTMPLIAVDHCFPLHDAFLT
jgi:hypothetical protein